MRTCPCKGCGVDRHVGCHANCRNYLSWREENLALQESVRLQKEVESALFSIKRYRQALMNPKKYGRGDDQ
ncbi:hypothetical protein [Yeguia hominis]|uniref:Uncharacterized protein n=1 Tax=Yeguia hominis TaxID=2763662 RepID=A0A926DAN9_9FIRM|nr:hypothetical protein [Yeguia hominis]MBC8534568.1 hypothetical protein [Yeguia hominis]